MMKLWRSELGRRLVGVADDVENYLARAGFLRTYGIGTTSPK
jgi:hypothetical protein